jgi:hypothetical protein
MKSRIYYPSRHEKPPDNLQTTAAGFVSFYWSRGQYIIRGSAILQETDSPFLNVLVLVGSRAAVRDWYPQVRLTPASGLHDLRRLSPRGAKSCSSTPLG